MNIKTDERKSLLHHADDSEVAKSGLPQIKRQFDAVSSMSVNRRAKRRMTVQSYIIILSKRNFPENFKKSHIFWGIITK